MVELLHVVEIAVPLFLLRAPCERGSVDLGATELALRGSLLDGRGEPGAWLESVLAEAQCALSNLGVAADLTPEDVAERQRAWLASIESGKRRMDRREAAAEPALPAGLEETAPAAIEELPSDAIGIDRRIVRELAPRLASSDLAFGRQLAKFFRVRGWHVLGFASEAQYARERLGMSRSAVYARITLAKRAAHLTEVGDALHEGRIGHEAATLIARVATPDTEAAWIERAGRRTHKHLKEEVDGGRADRADDAPGRRARPAERGRDRHRPSAGAGHEVRRLRAARVRHRAGGRRAGSSGPSAGGCAGEPARRHGARRAERAGRPALANRSRARASRRAERRGGRVRLHRHRRARGGSRSR